jgi:hypothetical protein
MQNNTIILAVDALNNGTPADQSFTRNEEYIGRTVYIGENHTLSARDTMTLYRSQPSVSGNFRGTAKTSVKFSSDTIVPGVDSSTTLTVPLIGEVSFSIPVGASSADVKELRQQIVAILDDDTIMDQLNLQLSI